MTERELLIKGVAKVFDMTEAQIEKALGETIYLCRPALLREVEAERLAVFQGMETEKWIPVLEGMGLSMRRCRTYLEKAQTA